jgi:ribosome maturation factor RimP
LFWSRTLQPGRSAGVSQCGRHTKFTTTIDDTDHGEETRQMTEDLLAMLQPVVAAADLELVDVELRSGVLLVTVDRAGGVDLQALTDANRAVSGVLDELDPIPGNYTLEVSSPGVERTLRTPAHFVKAVGETVSIKTRPQVPGERRRRGTLRSADEEGFELDVDDGGQDLVRLSYSDIDRARTVFVWGPDEHARGKKSGAASPTERGQSKSTEKRKQVVTP